MPRIQSVLLAVMLIASTALLPACGKKDKDASGPGSDKFCVALGWMENESGRRQKVGFETAFRDLGGEAVFANANYDPKKQSEQIDAFIKMKPRAIFVTPSDPAGIAAACQRVVDAGIPLFVADAIIPGAAATTSICSSDFRMGEWAMDYIARRLGGKGKVGIVDLPENESWDQRGQGARFALQKYPDIQLVAEMPYDSKGKRTPRELIDTMLTAHPKGDLDAIWCAWDGAAQEGAQAVEAAGRGGEIFTTGIDGGENAFKVIRSGGPFKLTMAQSIYYMSYQCVVYAKKHLDGKKVPRLIISPVYAVDKDVLDKLPAEFKAHEYDVPGNAKKFGWKPVL